MADMAKIEDWLGAIPSPQTRKNYRNGIRRFEEFYQKPIESILELSDVECGHVVEKFYSHLKQNHPQNTCRNVVNGLIQYPNTSARIQNTRKVLESTQRLSPLVTTC